MNRILESAVTMARNMYLPLVCLVFLSSPSNILSWPEKTKNDNRTNKCAEGNSYEKLRSSNAVCEGRRDQEELWGVRLRSKHDGGWPGCANQSQVRD